MSMYYYYVQLLFLVGRLYISWFMEDLNKLENAGAAAAAAAAMQSRGLRFV